MWAVQRVFGDDWRAAATEHPLAAVVSTRKGDRFQRIIREGGDVPGRLDNTSAMSEHPVLAAAPIRLND